MSIEVGKCSVLQVNVIFLKCTVRFYPDNTSLLKSYSTGFFIFCVLTVKICAPSLPFFHWHYFRWQCFYVTRMNPAFPWWSSRMLLMLMGSFSHQAPANNKGFSRLLRPISQTNATIGTKPVCKCTWAFLTCLVVYVAEGSEGFIHLCALLRANVLPVSVLSELWWNHFFLVVAPAVSFNNTEGPVIGWQHGSQTLSF